MACAGEANNAPWIVPRLGQHRLRRGHPAQGAAASSSAPRDHVSPGRRSRPRGHGHRRTVMREEFMAPQRGGKGRAARRPDREAVEPAGRTAGRQEGKWRNAWRGGGSPCWWFLPGNTARRSARWAGFGVAAATRGRRQVRANPGGGTGTGAAWWPGAGASAHSAGLLFDRMDTGRLGLSRRLGLRPGRRG